MKHKLCWTHLRRMSQFCMAMPCTNQEHSWVLYEHYVEFAELSYHGQNPVMFPLNTVFRQKDKERCMFHKHLDTPFSSCKMCYSVRFESWLVFPNVMNSEINLVTNLLYSKRNCEVYLWEERRPSCCVISFFSHYFK